jgi:hypothetical protein
MPRLTRIKDFLLRLEVDSDFMNRVADPERQDAAFDEYGLDDVTRAAIVNPETPTPIKDFLFRLEVDPDFVDRVLDEQERGAAVDEFEMDPATRTAIVDAIGSRNFTDLQSLVEAEDPGTDTVLILPRAWVR